MDYLLLYQDQQFTMQEAVAEQPIMAELLVPVAMAEVELLQMVLVRVKF